MNASQRRIVAALAVALAITGGLVALLLAQPNMEPVIAHFNGESTPQVQDIANAITLPPTWTHTPEPTPYRTATQTPSATATTLITLSSPVRPTLAAALTPSFIHPSSTLPIPTTVPVQSIPEEAITILLLGSDRRPDWDNWRTDAIQYVVVFPGSERPSVNLLSIPRDLYVYIPGFWMSRINFADMYGEMNDYAEGGFGLLNQTLLYNLGITADYYAMVDFDGLIGLVDAMDGIDVAVHCRLEDYWPYAEADGTFPRIVLEPGVHHMDGELALWYSRSRKTTSVFSREWRQQQVLEAMWHRAQSKDLSSSATTLFEQTHHLFETNLGIANILSLAVMAAQLDSTDIRQYNIGAFDVTPYTTPYGGAVYLPQWEHIQPIISSVLAPPASNRAPQDTVRIEVWNGTGHKDWDLLAADRLYHYGFLPVLGIADDQNHAQTELWYSTNEKGNRIEELLYLFDLGSASTFDSFIEPATPVRLILGEDYATCRR